MNRYSQALALSLRYMDIERPAIFEKCVLNENYRFAGVFRVSVLFPMSRRHSPHQSKIGTRHGSIRLAVKKA